MEQTVQIIVGLIIGCAFTYGLHLIISSINKRFELLQDQINTLTEASALTVALAIKGKLEQAEKFREQDQEAEKAETSQENSDELEQLDETTENNNNN